MREVAIQAGFWIGFAVIIGAAILCNIAFYGLNRAVNKAYDIRHRIDPWTGVFPERAGMKQVIEREFGSIRRRTATESVGSE